MTGSLSELENLRWQNLVLRQKRWASDETKLRRSEWFVLIDTKLKPKSDSEFEDAKAYCDALMEDFARAIKEGHIIKMNKASHRWDSQFIESVRVRYVVELGLGKLKKDGTRGKTGGTVHIHCLITIYHYSNISLPYENLVQFFEEPLRYRFGKKPFIGHPQLVKGSRTEEYMEKGFERAVWNEVQINIE